MATVKCPGCGQFDQVEKVSTLYLVGIGLNRQPKSGEAPLDLPPTNAWVSALPPAELGALARRLKPPSSGKQAFSRPLHPDMVVIVFSLVLPVFLYGMWTSQRAVLPAALAVLAVAYALYFWKRKAIIARFQHNRNNRLSADERARRGVERWMKLYYCYRDDGVFPAQGGELIPADQMPGYLFGSEG
jgi:hypothetical protein